MKPRRILPRCLVMPKWFDRFVCSLIDHEIDKSQFVIGTKFNMPVRIHTCSRCGQMSWSTMKMKKKRKK